MRINEITAFEKALRDRVAGVEPDLDGLTDAQVVVADHLAQENIVEIVKLLDSKKGARSGRKTLRR